MPGNAEILAYPCARAERGNGVTEPVELDQDEGPRRGNRIAVTFSTRARVSESHGLGTDAVGVGQVAAQHRDYGEHGCGGHGVADFGRRLPRLGRGHGRAVEVTQPHPDDARPTESGGPVRIRQHRGSPRLLEFGQPVGRASARRKHEAETGAHWTVRGWVVVAVEQAAAGLLRVGDSASPDQAACTFREQQVPPGIRRLHQLDRPLQQISCDIR